MGPPQDIHTHLGTDGPASGLTGPPQELRGQHEVPAEHLAEGVFVQSRNRALALQHPCDQILVSIP